jgi:hypothetical protein
MSIIQILLLHHRPLPDDPLFLRLTSTNKNDKMRRRLANTKSPTPAPTPITCFPLPFLDLEANPPIIDGMIDRDNDGLLDGTPGWSGNEYSTFVNIPMYNAGRNNDGSEIIGNSYTGYDCSTNKLCVAAYLIEPYFSLNDCSVDRSSASSWVSINGGSNKYFVPNSDTLSSHYVEYPDDSPGGTRLIGKQTHQTTSH